MGQGNAFKLSSHLQGIELEFPVIHFMGIAEIDRPICQKDGEKGGRHIAQGRSVDMAMAKGCSHTGPSCGPIR
jgi:hypothetical protein